MSLNKIALKYAIYKGLNGKFGAVQFSFVPPLLVCKEDSTHRYNLTDSLVTRTDQCPSCRSKFPDIKEGGLFLEAAAPLSPSVYDWKNKVVMFLAIKDLGIILANLPEKNVTIVHDPGAASDKKGLVVKTLSFQVKDAERGAILCLQVRKREADPVNLMIPLLREEVVILLTLFRAAIPTALAWI